MDKELEEIGVGLGADVPYCLMGGTALSEGIGEIITVLPKLPDCYILVAKPRCSVSTAEAYGGYDGLIEKETYIRRPDVDMQVDRIYAGDLDGAACHTAMRNVLEQVTKTRHPEIKDLEEMMLKNGAINSIMTGSGPTVFGIFRDEGKAAAAAGEIRESDLSEEIYITRPL